MVVLHYESYQLAPWFTGNRWLAKGSLKGHIFGENLMDIDALNQQ